MIWKQKTLWFTCQIKNIALDVLVVVMYSEKSERTDINVILVAIFGLGRNNERNPWPNPKPKHTRETADA